MSWVISTYSGSLLSSHRASREQSATIIIVTFPDLSHVTALLYYTGPGTALILVRYWTRPTTRRNATRNTSAAEAAEEYGGHASKEGVQSHGPRHKTRAELATGAQTCQLSQCYLPPISMSQLMKPEPELGSQGDTTQNGVPLTTRRSHSWSASVFLSHVSIRPPISQGYLSKTQPDVLDLISR